MSTQRTVPQGAGERVEMRAGEQLRITTPDGSRGGDFSFLGFDQAMTRNINGWERHGRPWLVFSADPGMRLYDGEGTPIMEVGECVGDGRNDIMYPGCWSEIYEDGRPGCRDLISKALGIERREITGMLSFFVNSSADSEEYRGLAEVSLQPGDHITLIALRDVTAAVSTCPDTEISGWRDGELVIEVNRPDNSNEEMER